MTPWWWVLLVAVFWLAIGLLTAAWFVIRAGHPHLLWYVVGGLLGPLFIPIAVERGRAGTAVVDMVHRPSTGKGTGLRVAVGVDGSAESDRALRAIARALSRTASELVLVTVTSPDSVGEDVPTEQREARRMLDQRSDALPAGLPRPTIEIVRGHPVDALLAVAEAHDVDLLVVGRHGHGVRDRLLGSVAEELARRSSRALLLGSLPDR
ncbi:MULTISPECIES: universal stress protein [Micromonospora]|uniref:Universal stress protein n=1 Tax=Micromonospora solifontis TaxID=2487138 RepID=A0ABX9WCZ3_9ACTN|nr:MULTISPECIES: universal stress protein [Micromonospora]NES12817.1 universal stress protein [Micromonospora sp. PPF5-17B]NES38923.1 universal stress protein [Micromonospora solifontis]NES54742.1 universal stress protein [Micromonospora sp. PPF5-6]RNL92583.1 universal stress protein [Micromonospora solifontis]